MFVVCTCSGGEAVADLVCEKNEDERIGMNDLRHFALLDVSFVVFRAEREQFREHVALWGRLASRTGSPCSRHMITYGTSEMI